MTDSELLDRIVDAYAFLGRAKVYAEGKPRKRITTGHRLKEGETTKLITKALANELRQKAQSHFTRCISDARHASFQRRGILPHGANGAVLFPEGTRKHIELDHLEESLLRLKQMPEDF